MATIIDGTFSFVHQSLSVYINSMEVLSLSGSIIPFLGNIVYSYIVLPEYAHLLGVYNCMLWWAVYVQLFEVYFIHIGHLWAVEIHFIISSMCIHKQYCIYVLILAVKCQLNGLLCHEK